MLQICPYRCAGLAPARPAVPPLPQLLPPPLPLPPLPPPPLLLAAEKRGIHKEKRELLPVLHCEANAGGTCGLATVIIRLPTGSQALLQCGNRPSCSRIQRALERQSDVRGRLSCKVSYSCYGLGKVSVVPERAPWPRRSLTT